jgi:hypothetical protein
MNLKKLQGYLRVNLGPGPRLIKKRIYRAGRGLTKIDNTAVCNVYVVERWLYKVAAKCSSESTK